MGKMNINQKANISRLDLSGFLTILGNFIKVNKWTDQVAFLSNLFSREDSGELVVEEVNLDEAKCSRWIQGKERLSPKLVDYYVDNPTHLEEFRSALLHHIFPILSDLNAAGEELRNLMDADFGISAEVKQQLTDWYPSSSEEDREEALSYFMTDLFHFVLTRPFQEHPLVPSPRIDERFENVRSVPRPCGWYQADDELIYETGRTLQKFGRVFLFGSEGIGKSEMAYKLVDQLCQGRVRKYTNILYIESCGYLERDLLKIRDRKDLDRDTDEVRLRNRISFLETLREDSLIVIDGYNTQFGEDPLLDTIMNLRCHIVFTSRCQYEVHGRVDVQAPPLEGLRKIARYFAREKCRDTDRLDYLIGLLWGNPYLVEGAARLLHSGYDLDQLTRKFEQESVYRMDADEKIPMGARNQFRKRKTFHECVDQLFELYLLRPELQYVLSTASLSPADGIDRNWFKELLNLGTFNEINALLELGLLRRYDNVLNLIPLTREAVENQLRPKITCLVDFLGKLDDLFCARGIAHPMRNQAYEVVLRIIDVCEKDEIRGLRLFLQNAFCYMDEYGAETKMKRTYQELKRIERDYPEFHDVCSEAVLEQFRSRMEPMPLQEAIRRLDGCLTKLNLEDSYHRNIALNLLGNKFGILTAMYSYEQAEQVFHQIGDMRKKFSMPYNADCLTQDLAFVEILRKTDRCLEAEGMLLAMEKTLEGYTGGQQNAMILAELGKVYRLEGRIEEAEQAWRTARNILSGLYPEDPTMFARVILASD